MIQIYADLYWCLVDFSYFSNVLLLQNKEKQEIDPVVLFKFLNLACYKVSFFLLFIGFFNLCMTLQGFCAVCNFQTANVPILLGNCQI